MNEFWHAFAASGSINDYLAYKNLLNAHGGENAADEDEYYNTFS